MPVGLTWMQRSHNLGNQARQMSLILVFQKTRHRAPMPYSLQAPHPAMMKTGNGVRILRTLHKPGTAAQQDSYLREPGLQLTRKSHQENLHR